MALRPVSSWALFLALVGCQGSSSDGIESLNPSVTECSSGFGLNICSLGDSDGDGVPEFAVSQPASIFDFNARIWIISSTRRTPLFSIATEREWDVAQDRFGYSMTAVGDTNADGIADLLVGSPYYGEREGRAQAHATALILSGSNGALILKVRGESPDDEFGWSTIGAGDVNGDGCPDFAVGAYLGGEHQEGYVVVYSGMHGRPLLRLTGKSPGDQFGYALVLGDDYDGDGVSDLIIGATQGAGTKRVGPGYVAVVSARTGVLLETISGEKRDPKSGGGDRRFGRTLGVIAKGAEGGRSLVAIGADHWAADLTLDGMAPSVRVYSPDTWSELYRIAGNSWTMLGATFVISDDLDGDGFADLVVGAPDANDLAGGVSVFSGRDGRLLYSISPKGVQWYLGQSIASLHDIDGDGYGDFAIGIIQPGAADNSVEGIVDVYSGQKGVRLYRLDCPAMGVGG